MSFNDFTSERISSSGVRPSASTLTRSPCCTSSAIPRAMVRDPSLRISMISRATTGGSGSASRSGASGFFSSGSFM